MKVGCPTVPVACNQSVPLDVRLSVLKPGKSWTTGISCLPYMQIQENYPLSYAILRKSFEFSSLNIFKLRNIFVEKEVEAEGLTHGN